MNIEKLLESNAKKRLKNSSYPERCFIKFLEENEYDKKYLIIREYPIFPYYIDFAFINEKLAVEIDGSQHLLPERIESDKKKNQLLEKNGWKVLRFSEKIVKTDWNLIKEKLNEFLSKTNKKTFEMVGVICYVSYGYEKKKRGEDGLTDLEREKNLKMRKVERPSKEVLKNLINEKKWKDIGEIYNVSDTTIKKWAKYYNLPSTTYEKKGIKKEEICPIIKCENCGKDFKCKNFSNKKINKHFCSKKCLTEFTKKETKFQIDGKTYEITKKYIEENKHKYKNISDMAKKTNVSRFLLARRIKEFNIIW